MDAPMTASGDDTRPEQSRRVDGLFETDIGDRKPSEAVVDAVAAIADTEPAKLSPLYRTVDPEALDALCRNPGASAQPTVQFNYEGFVVTVTDTDGVSIVEP